jgi:hypothetical protein
MPFVCLLREISVDEVFYAVQNLLAQTNARPIAAQR